MMNHRVLKITLPGFALLLLLFLVSNSRNYAAESVGLRTAQAAPESGTLQRMIVESGSVTIELDVHRPNDNKSSLHAGASAANWLNLKTATLPTQMHFAAAANSFFSVLVFNNLLRGPEAGSIALIAQTPLPALPPMLSGSLNQLVVEKLPSDAAFDLAVRDSKTGFTFFNVTGQQYRYDAGSQSLTITDGNLLLAKDFADALGWSSDEGARIGKISIGVAMQPVEVQTIVNGEVKSVVMPPLRNATAVERPTLVAGPDVIVGVLPEMAQYGSSGSFVGLGIGTTSCNNGDQPLHWFALPQTDHPVIPQNFYRMTGGANNNDRFEQIGQSWLKHAFLALENNACDFGCNTSGCTTGSNLCPGCSDPYDSSLNASQTGIGSRAWVNPFTGSVRLDVEQS